MVRFAVCVAALGLACFGGAAVAPAWDGGASAPQPTEPTGGLAAPAEDADVVGIAQVDEPDAGQPGAEQPDSGRPAPAPVVPDPNAGVPEAGQPDGEPQPPPADDRGVRILVPLPDEPATAESPPAVVPTSISALPRTGQDTGLLALAGLVLLTAGAGLWTLSRRVRAASA